MSTSHPILRHIALALAVSAIAGPAVSARPSQAAQSQSATASLDVRPNPDQQTGQPGTDAPVTKEDSASPLGTGSNPRGVAIGTQPPRQTVNDRNAVTNTLAQTHGSVDDVAAADSAGVAPPAITAPGDDFDYGAAALGAGITAAIAALIAAGTLGLRHLSRTRHP